jgi:hypothetical protein
MPSIVYIGPHQDAEVPYFSLYAPRGVPVDVEDDVAEHLLQQVTTWAAAGSPDADRAVQEQADQAARIAAEASPPAPDRARAKGSAAAAGEETKR